MLFIDGRFSRDQTVMTNVGHSCCRSYQRYADLLVGRHGEHRRFTMPERQKPTDTVEKLVLRSGAVTSRKFDLIKRPLLNATGLGDGGL